MVVVIVNAKGSLIADSMRPEPVNVEFTIKSVIARTSSKGAYIPGDPSWAIIIQYPSRPCRKISSIAKRMISESTVTFSAMGPAARVLQTLASKGCN